MESMVGRAEEPGRGGHHVIEHLFAARIEQVVAFEGVQSGSIVGGNERSGIVYQNNLLKKACLPRKQGEAG
jgi:hypothetical protein